MRIIILFISVIIAWPCYGQSIKPYGCRNGAFPSYNEGFKLAEIHMPDHHKSYIYDDYKGCPYKERCRENNKALISGDEVLVGKVQDGWSCVWYNGKDEESVGWMRSKNIQKISIEQKPALLRWVGTWLFYESDDTLTISQAQNGKKLKVEGTASWSNGRGVTNLGSIDASAQPAENMLKVGAGQDENGCKMRLTLVAQYLVVSDNHDCGGINVNFDGVYLKKTALQKNKHSKE